MYIDLDSSGSRGPVGFWIECYGPNTGAREPVDLVRLWTVMGVRLSHGTTSSDFRNRDELNLVGSVKERLPFGECGWYNLRCRRPVKCITGKNTKENYVV